MRMTAVRIALPVLTWKGNKWLKVSFPNTSELITPMIERAPKIIPHLSAFVWICVIALMEILCSYQAMIMPPNCSSRQQKKCSNANPMTDCFVYLWRRSVRWVISDRYSSRIWSMSVTLKAWILWRIRRAVAFVLLRRIRNFILESKSRLGRCSTFLHHIMSFFRRGDHKSFLFATLGRPNFNTTTQGVWEFFSVEHMLIICIFSPITFHLAPLSSPIITHSMKVIAVVNASLTCLTRW